MPVIKGKITSALATSGLLDDSEIIGGYKTVETKAELDKLKTDEIIGIYSEVLEEYIKRHTLTNGCVVYVVDENAEYRWDSTAGEDGKGDFVKEEPAVVGGSESNINNLEDGSGTGAVQQIADGVADGFNFTGKNPNAEAIDPDLSKVHDYGGVGDYSNAFGGKSSAQGKRSHAEGTTTIAKGKYSHAEGDNSVTLGDDSHAEGYATTAHGTGSHTEGANTLASGVYSHAEGVWTKTTEGADGAHAEGYYSEAQGYASHAEGNSTAIGSYSHAEGGSTAEGEKSHAEGASVAHAPYAHSEGWGHAYDTASHAEGRSAARGDWSHAEGESVANANSAHAEGRSKAEGVASHAEGDATATANFAHAEGGSTANGNYSHAEGHSTAVGENAHAEGANCFANGDHSHAGGVDSVAESWGSFAHGQGVKAAGTAKMAVGRYNSPDGDALFEVGNGTADDDRKTAFKVMLDGRAKVQSPPIDPEDVVRLGDLPNGGEGTQIVTVAIEEMLGLQDVDKFTELSQRFLNGEINIHVSMNIGDEHVSKAVLSHVIYQGDENMAWVLVSASAFPTVDLALESEQLIIGVLQKRESNLLFGIKNYGIGEFVRKIELEEFVFGLPDNASLTEESKKKWCNMIGAVPSKIPPEGYRQVYIVEKDGTNNICRLADAIPFSAIPIGDNHGRIFTGDPVLEYNATNKRYVDNLPDNLTFTDEQKAKWQKFIGSLQDRQLSIEGTLDATENLFHWFTIKDRFTADPIVDWGDGTINTSDDHRYENAGEYTVKIYGLNELATGVFYNSFFTKVNIYASVTSIDRGAFASSVVLKEINIPNSVKVIGEQAFSNCPLLQFIHYDGFKSDWDNITIDTGNDNLLSATKIFKSGRKLLWEEGRILMANASVELLGETDLYGKRLLVGFSFCPISIPTAYTVKYVEFTPFTIESSIVCDVSYDSAVGIIVGTLYAKSGAGDSAIKGLTLSAEIKEISVGGGGSGLPGDGSSFIPSNSEALSYHIKEIYEIL